MRNAAIAARSGIRRMQRVITGARAGMRHMRRLAAASTVWSGMLWGANCWNVFSRAMPGRGGVVLGQAAVMFSIISAVLWSACEIRDLLDDRRDLIILTADLYHRIPEDARPPILRSAPTQGAQRGQ